MSFKAKPPDDSIFSDERLDMNFDLRRRMAVYESNPEFLKTRGAIELMKRFKEGYPELAEEFFRKVGPIIDQETSEKNDRR